MNLNKVDTLDFLTALKVKNIHDKDEEIVFSCPFPSGHKNKDRNPSASMNKTSTAFFCHSCGASGNAISFLARLENIPHTLSEKFIRDRYGDETDSGFILEEHFNSIFNKKHVKEEYLPVYLDKFESEFRQKELIKNKDARDYLENRGITQKSIERFRLGYDVLSDRISIPLFDSSENLVGIKARSIHEDNKPKYIYLGDNKGPKRKYGFPVLDTKRFVYNLNFVKNNYSSLIVVEGELNAIYLDQAGFSNAVALGGSKISEHQINILLYFAKEIILFLDDDEAGNKCKNEIYKRMNDYMPILQTGSHDGDPGSMSVEECVRIISEAKSPIEKIFE